MAYLLHISGLIRMYRLTNKRGYTLTELMVTVAIIGIVAAIGVPSYLSYLPHLRLNSAARDLISDLRLARSLAVGQNQKYYILFDATTEQYRIYRSSGDAPVRPLVNYLDTTNPNYNYSGIRIDSVVDKNGTAITIIEFDFNGTAFIGKGTLNSVNMPVTITIKRSDGTESKTINVTRFGRIYAG